MPLGSIPAGAIAEVRGAALALKVAPREVRNAINRATRANVGPIWKDEVAGKVSGLPRVDQLVLGRGARVTPGNPVVVAGATSTRPLSGGLVPTQRAKGFEFGTDDRERRTNYMRDNPKSPGRHRVNRRTTRHLPRRTPQGRVIWPAVSETLPRMTSLWVQTIVRTINEQLGN